MNLNLNPMGHIARVRSESGPGLNEGKERSKMLLEGPGRCTLSSGSNVEAASVLDVCT